MNDLAARVIKLLIVDDHQLILDGTKAALDPYEDLEVVGLASTGRDALRSIELLRPDVVLLDIRLPDVSGLEVVRQVHEKWPGTHIIAISGYDDSRYVRGLRKLGVSAYLSKSVSTAELSEAIRAVAAGKAAPGLPPQAHPGLLEPLTPREFQVLQLIGQGLRNGEIASSLSLSIKAVEYHVTHILEKLDARSRSEAIVKAAHILDIPAYTSSSQLPD